MEFLILGPLEVWEDGVELPLGGPRTRALLALLQNGNTIVPVTRESVVEIGTILDLSQASWVIDHRGDAPIGRAVAVPAGRRRASSGIAAYAD